VDPPNDLDCGIWTDVSDHDDSDTLAWAKGSLSMGGGMSGVGETTRPAEISDEMMLDGVEEDTVITDEEAFDYSLDDSTRTPSLMIILIPLVPNKHCLLVEETHTSWSPQKGSNS
jgi:hypothetical protein